MRPGDSQPLLNTCPSCQEIIDVSSVRPYEKIHCPLCGDTIRVRTNFNHFTLKGEIGQGGMSRVFRATDNNLGREVALKILHSRQGDQAQLAAQFEREAKITASITHPNVVQVYSVGQDQGYYYIAMELLPSQSVEQLITSRSRIPEIEALRIIRQVTLGLAAAHQHGLIHRDVKPGNVLLDHDGTAKLVDFGLALIQGTEEDPMAEIWATPFYVPPEKLWNRPEDFRSDIYSLGATLYHMIAGRPPHCAETDSIQELITIKSQPLDLRAGASHMHDATLQLISRMMAYDPPARYASYEALLSAIEALQRKIDPQAAPEPEGFPLWAKATAALIGISFLGLLAALVGGGSTTVPPDSPPLENPIHNSNPLVVSAEGAHLSQLLSRGREALLTQDPAKALPLFQELASSDRARADWRSWATFHVALEQLFQGDLDAASSSFAQSASLSLTLDQELTDFFAELETTFKNQGPPPPPRNGASPLIALRSLAYGLKSWIAADFPNTSLHLGHFLQGKFASSFAWASTYHPRATSLQADAALLASLPSAASSANLDELTAHLDHLVTVHAQLQDDRSRRTVARSISSAEKHIAQLMEAVQAAASSQAMSSDYAMIRETRRATLELTASRRFAEAASAWRSTSLETDAAKEAATHHAEACEEAARFLDLFAAALPPNLYEGEILRTEGRSFSAKVLRATPDALIVDLGFGPTPLNIDSISSRGLLQIAQSTVLRGAGPDLLQAACFFASFTGEESEARRLADSLRDSPGFSPRWDAVSGPLPSTP